MTVNSTLQGTIVGVLACQKDSYLRTLETEVISCVKQETPVSNVVNGKGAKKDVAKERPKEMWEIEFADSVLFPEGGGQHSDHGTLQLLDDSAAPQIPITVVQRIGLRCVAQSPSPITPRTRVRQEVDWDRRWHHMQQHTGQHLLSAIMDTYDDLETLGWGMGKAGEMNYVDLPRRPTSDEIQQIQKRCNEVIRENIQIGVEEVMGNGEKVEGEKLPENYDKGKGVVRVIGIGEIDKNPCCGTHLKQTSHIALILLHSMQSIRSKNCRLFFSAGDQAVKFATSCVSAVGAVARTLGCANDGDEVTTEVSRTSESFTESRRREKKYLSEIAAYEGSRVRALLEKSERGTAWVHRGDASLDFLNKVISEVKDVVGKGAVVLAGGEEKKGGPIVVVGEKGRVEEMIEKIKEVVKEVKGGGGGGKWQGKVVCWQKGELAALKKVIEE